MDKIRKIIAQYGIEGLMGIFFAIVAIGVAIYEFLGGNAISSPVLVALLAVLLIEVYIQRSKLDRNRDEIIGSLGGVKIEVFANSEQLKNKQYQLLAQTKDTVFDTELCLPKGGKTPYTPGSFSKYRKLLNQRVQKGELKVRIVQAIYDQRRFESLLWALFSLGNYKYYIGCYIGAPDVIPVLNVMGFDNEHYFIGGYYGPTVRGEDRNLYIHHEEIGTTILHYFEYLWGN
jgi:hypothetical protein